MNIKDEAMEDRLNRVERDLGHIKVTNDSTATSIERMAVAIERLVIIETEHKQTRESVTRAFKEIDANDARISTIERRTETWDAAARICDDMSRKTGGWDSTSQGLRWLIWTIVAAALGLVWFKATGVGG